MDTRGHVESTCTLIQLGAPRRCGDSVPRDALSMCRDKEFYGDYHLCHAHLVVDEIELFLSTK